MAKRDPASKETAATWSGGDTRITASLPNVDIEIRRRDEGEDGEVVTVRMRAVPGFDAAARSLAPAFPMLLVAANPYLSGPLTAWLRFAQTMWAPWLRALPAPHSEDGERMP